MYPLKECVVIEYLGNNSKSIKESFKYACESHTSGKNIVRTNQKVHMNFIRLKRNTDAIYLYRNKLITFLFVYSYYLKLFIS